MTALCPRTATTSGRRRRTSGFSNSKPPASRVFRSRQNFAGASGPSWDASLWTLDDDKRLLELRAKGASYNEIANALGRTEAAIEQRAHNLRRQGAAQHLW